MFTFVIQIVGSDIVQRVFSIIGEGMEEDPLMWVIKNMKWGEVDALRSFYKSDTLIHRR